MKLKYHHLLIVSLFVIISTIVACKSKKNIAKNNEVKKDSVKAETKPNNIKPAKVLSFTVNNWSTFSSKINIEYESEAHSLPINSFSGQIRMSKDNYIWMTIQVPILGEAVRALITKDSVKVLDRYNKRYLLTNFSYLQKFSSVPLSLDKLQDALIGNPTFKLKDATIDTSDNMMMAIFQDAKVKNTIFALFNNLRVKKNIYIDKIQNVDITAIYPEFEEIEGQQIPKKINLSTTKPDKSTIDLEYNGTQLNKPITAEFNIPASYKKLQ
jgi:hypothetical protein